MIKVTDSRGNVKVRARIGNVTSLTRRSIRRAWFGLGKDLRAEASAKILSKDKTGEVYIVRGPRGRRRRHRASAGRETHANITGRTRRSISWRVYGTDRMDFGYGVSVTGRNQPPRHASFLEFGTSRMDARPSLLNAINATQRNMETHFRQAMDEEFRR